MIAGSHEDNNRRELLRLERISRVRRLYVRGVPMFRIAQELDITAKQARKDIELLKRYLLKAAEKAGKHLLTKELAKLDEIEAVAWEEWERSKQDRVSITKVQRQTYDTNTSAVINLEETRETREAQCGDPRLLDVMLRNAAHRAKLLKLDAPEAASVAQPNIVQVIVDTPEQVARMMHYDDFSKLTVTADARRIDDDEE